MVQPRAIAGVQATQLHHTVSGAKNFEYLTHRPAVLRACFRALKECGKADGAAFREAAVRAREQYRMAGRMLPKRGVGSTLLLKGLEAEVCVVVEGDKLNA